MAKQDLNVQCSLSIEVNPEQTEATLLFSQGSEKDKVWATTDLVQLIQAERIAGAKLDDLLKTIGTLVQKKEKSARIPLVQGSPPTAPKAEEFSMLDLPLPMEWKEAVSSTLAHAGDPAITREIQVKVEREVTVVKKGPLPFLPGKEEKQTITEKEKKLEPVEVDPKVLNYGYAVEGTKIGQIFPAKPGVPGKDVRGQILPPPSLDEPTFYVGSNLVRKGSEVSAARSGIIRRGVNWIDLIPFSQHSWEIKESSDHATCYLHFTPGSPFLPAPSPEQILAKAIELGHPKDDLIEAALIDQHIKDAIDHQKPLEQMTLSQAKDAFFDVLISEDNLKAVLNVVKGSAGGKQLVLKELGKAISDSKVKIDKEKVQKDISAWMASSERSLIGYVLAEGKAPEAGPPQSLAWTVSFLDEKEAKSLREQILPRLGEDMSSFPKDAVKAVAKVEKDQKLLTLGPIAPGKPGVDVFGAAIAPAASQTLEYQVYGPITKAGSNVLSAGSNGVLFKAEQGSKLYLALLEFQDGQVEVEIAPDKMSAYLTLEGHLGAGKPVTREMVLAAIDKAGVKKGILTDVVEASVAAGAKGEILQSVIVAKGQTPSEAAAGQVKWLIEFATGQAVTLRSDGRADYRNQDKITTVKKDTLIAEILPPATASNSGWDVCGKDLPPPPPREPELAAGENIVQEKKEDGTIVLKANADGEVKVDKKILSIFAAYNVKGNVDAAIGNIKFPGNVQITGDVMAGFFVMSNGEIRIGGSVEGSLLSAEGDILIGAGVKGMGKAVLRSKKSIMASFIELSTVMAIGDIKIKKALLRSKVKCNSRIILADDGHLIGGEIRVRNGIQVGNLGNANMVPTHVFFGQDILVDDQIQTTEKELNETQNKLTQLNTAMKSVERLNDKAQLQKLFNEKFVLMKQLEKLNLRLFTLKERFEQHFPSEIIVKGTLFPGVILESHGRTREFTKELKAVRLSFDTQTGRINDEPLEQTKA